jgi:hypothetical protein
MFATVYAVMRAAAAALSAGALKPFRRGGCSEAAGPGPRAHEARGPGPRLQAAQGRDRTRAAWAETEKPSAART